MRTQAHANLQHRTEEVQRYVGKHVERTHGWKQSRGQSTPFHLDLYRYLVFAFLGHGQRISFFCYREQRTAPNITAFLSTNCGCRLIIVDCNAATSRNLTYFEHAYRDRMSSNSHTSAAFYSLPEGLPFPPRRNSTVPSISQRAFIAKKIWQPRRK